MTSDEKKQDIKRRDDAQFQHDVKALLQSAEDTRMRYMRMHRGRTFTTLTLTILFVIIGGGAFGWFFLMEFKPVIAIACVLAAVFVPLLLQPWKDAPVKAYSKAYKSEFMPQMAKALGGLRFYPSRGISSKIVNKAGVIEPYKTYDAEDCFMGKYKDVKVILSEARLYADKKRKVKTFDGIFVLLELPEKIIEGHTIITADYDMAKKYAPTRWRKFQETSIQTSNKSWDRFQIFSTKPESASLFVGERLLKELAEAADIFKKSPLSAVLFAKKYIFIAIPYDENMFEASNMNIPVATQRIALQCKREIEQIFEIIDIYEIYKSGSSGSNMETIFEPEASPDPL
jgi:hypothetical protein